MPLPCRSAIFSSRVICFSTSSARSSGERLEFIQGWFAFCAMTEPAAAVKTNRFCQYDDCPWLGSSQSLGLHALLHSFTICNYAICQKKQSIVTPGKTNAGRCGHEKE